MKIILPPKEQLVFLTAPWKQSSTQNQQQQKHSSCNSYISQLFLTQSVNFRVTSIYYTQSVNFRATSIYCTQSCITKTRCVFVVLNCLLACTSINYRIMFVFNLKKASHPINKVSSWNKMAPYIIPKVVSQKQDVCLWFWIVYLHVHLSIIE